MNYAGRIFSVGPVGAWDEAKVSCPVVLREGDRYRMWYYGREPEFPGNPGPGSPFGRSGLAESSDGVNWERVPGPGFRGSILDPASDPEHFDSLLLGNSSVVRRDGEYWFYYLGARLLSAKEQAGRTLDRTIAVGLATSIDGIHLVKYHGDAGRGAVLTPGGPGDFDELYTNLPRVIALPSGGWRMYYHGSGPNSPPTIGVAESADGLHWEKRGPVFGPNSDPAAFDHRSVSTRSVIPWEGGYLMAYEALPAGQGVDFRIGIATSPDGLAWKRLPGPGFGGCALDLGGPDAWDAMAIGTPWLLPMPDGTLRLYYVGFSGTIETAIGMATCDGHDLTRWEKFQS